MARILVIDNYRQTLTVIRSLAEAGHHVILGKDRDKKIFTELSRHVVQTWVHPKIEGNERKFVHSLKEFIAANPGIDYVFPVGEGAITCLASHICELNSVRILMPDVNTLSTCLNKDRLMEIVNSSGIPMEDHLLARNMSELEGCAEQLGYPVVIKPNDSMKRFYDKKIITCHSQNELRNLFPVWPDEHSILIVQRLATGQRHNCYFAAFQGRLIAYFENIIIRTDRADGSGYYVEGLSIAPTDELVKNCKKLIGLLKYHGVGCIQFLHDKKTGRTHFLELNPRLGANCALPYYCGMDFPRYALECRQEGFIPPSTVRQNYSINRRMHWLMGDIRGLIAERDRNNLTALQSLKWLSRIVLTLIRADYHITWSRKDPLPTLLIYAEFLERAVHKLGRIAGVKKAA